MTWAGALAGLTRAGAAEIRGGREAATAAVVIPRLETAAQAFDRGDMPAYAAVARRRQSRLVGDAAAAREADRSLRRRGVRDPERLAAVFAPDRRQPL